MIHALLFSAVVSAASLPGVQENNAGVERLKEKQPYQAYRHFVQGLASDPFNPSLRLNLGLTYELNEEKEKALKEYKSALRHAPEGSPERFAALFNAAVLSGGLGQVEAALSYYQQALAIEPDSKEVKTNIELLWQQMQSKSGQGQGDPQKNKDQKSGQNKPQDGDQQNQKDQEQKNQGEGEVVNRRKMQKRPFNSKELSQNDVRKILEELKNQEQKIRSRVYNKNVKQRPKGKDW